MQLSAFGFPEDVVSGMHRSRSGQARQFHQLRLLEKIEPPYSFRRVGMVDDCAVANAG
jgi:hypothetical protein